MLNYKKKRAYGFERLDQTGEFEPRAPERRILLERLDENVDRLVHLTQFAQYDAITRSYMMLFTFLLTLWVLILLCCCFLHVKRVRIELIFQVFGGELVAKRLQTFKIAGVDSIFVFLD